VCGRNGRTTGACVTLIEEKALPGGTAAGLRHRFLCGLFSNSAGFPVTFLNPGLTGEFCERLSPGVQTGTNG